MVDQGELLRRLYNLQKDYEVIKQNVVTRNQIIEEHYAALEEDQRLLVQLEGALILCNALLETYNPNTQVEEKVEEKTEVQLEEPKSEVVEEEKQEASV